MNRLFLLGFFLLLSALSSCDGSFGPRPDGPTGGTPDGLSENVWYHHTGTLTVSGIIQPVPNLGPWSLSAGMRIMVGWEAGTPTDPKLIFTSTSIPYVDVFGSSILDSTFGFTLLLGDSLLGSVVHTDSITNGKIAIGHIFLVSDSKIQERSIVSFTHLTDYAITGASDRTVILFREGTPYLRDSMLTDANSQQGYDILISASADPLDDYKIDFYLSILNILPTTLDIAVMADNSRSDIKLRNPLWLY